MDLDGFKRHLDTRIPELMDSYDVPGAVVAVIRSGEIEFSGKAGASVALGESTSAYGEVSFVTGDDDNGYGIKTGIKHNF